MKHGVPELNLKKLAGGGDSRVSEMLAELEGTAPGAADDSLASTLWTQQFAASGKNCEPAS